jgi:hypothetical protein
MGKACKKFSAHAKYTKRFWWLSQKKKINWKILAKRK